MKIREYIKDKKILMDGAFGTYFAQAVGDKMLPEAANLLKPDVVKGIHKEYIQAGAVMIRTNTFASNKETLQCSDEELVMNVKSACRIAREAVKEARNEKRIEEKQPVFIAGDIGPIPVVGEPDREAIQNEYEMICGAMLEEGVDAFVFESFSDYDRIKAVIENIKKKYDVFVLVQFSVNQFGYTNSGISIKRIFEEVSGIEEVEAIGLNCGVGPGHLYQIISELNIQTDKYISVLPNASYPKLMKDRMVFMENQDYFTDRLVKLTDMGVDFVGGCCGTTPEYIKKLAKKVQFDKKQVSKSLFRKKDVVAGKEKSFEKTEPKHAFYEDEKNGEKLIAVELAPPFKADDEKLLDAANYLKVHKTHAVTFPDSPSGRTRADSILVGVKVMEKTGVCAMPHICCRDKNSIAIRSQLLGAYMNGIRNLLVVTGDPVPQVLRGEVKSVYNFDSVGLMRIIQEMNETEFAKDPMVYGGAINYNRPNMDVEIGRMKKKMEAGASFFLTQPLFTKADADRLREMNRQMPARILCGIMPLVSRKNALFMKNEMAGINVTEETVNRYRENMSREEGEAVGISIAKEIMEYTKDFAAGYYFSIPFNRVHLLDQILK
ncbi:MAG: bifunctional homocysteine S-methyltransferase/methylenetetrahydrofolate reductase [Lachnospiraceae bacterium]|nr:bifunctional homocysteine S-methyltransferase/methylenetetrahydrofolate reductase [Lachnospiraceae bacterium]